MPQILKRLVPSALLVCVLAAVYAAPAGALPVNVAGKVYSVTRAEKAEKQDSLCREANKVRKQVVKKFGSRAPGRDICTFGLSGGKQPSANTIGQYLQTMKRMLNPTPQATGTPQPISSSTVTEGAAATTYNTSASTVLPACASESGTNYSTGPGNTNPSSGATGRYQITPGTHAALCSDLGWSPSAQDQCALRIYKAQGIGAWTGCVG